MTTLPNELPQHPLFTTQTEFLSDDERISLSYQRAKLVMRKYRLSLSDVQHCSSKYWDLIGDPVLGTDGALATLLLAHIGLVIGSLSRHVRKRPDLGPLVDRLLRFDTVGLYLLTERGHGLDAFNIETTATKTAQGFIIHTPREEACKYMPPSTPFFGIPKVALVMARMIVDGEDRGSRFFIVPICNEREMFKGVESIRLGPRSGTTPLDFAITRFNHVYVPHTALVSSNINDYSAPKIPLLAWWNEAWRIPIGSMAMVAPLLSGFRSVAFIAGRYSMHRSLAGKGPEPVPIISFRTQQWPILNSVAASVVMDNWYSRTKTESINVSLDPRVRHGLSVIVKSTVCRHVQRCTRDVYERCGAQGTFENNFMVRFENDSKGTVIAEGDIMTVCIRLLSELLQDRYQIPLPDPSESLLARHAMAVLEENRALLKKLPGGHRSEEFNALILPQAEQAIEAMGHAMAYSVGLQSGLPKPLLDIYECAAIRHDSAWYAEQGGLTRLEQRVREDKAVVGAMPHLAQYLEDLHANPYVSAPIVSDMAWKKYFNGLPVIKGNALCNFGQVEARL